MCDWRGIAGLAYIRGRMGLNYGYQPAALETFGKTLDKAASIARRMNAKILFVYLSGKDRCGTILGSTNAGGYGAAFIQRAKKAGFEVVDIDNAFRQTGRDPGSFFSGHYSGEGHAVVADAIETALRRKNR